ncbi:MAG: transcription-repair coupling factor [Candidatus Ratteibacteria bacterium]|nr:transcription-repair coupling factor [Candidatus Ratteibacteria bacterium]
MSNSIEGLIKELAQWQVFKDILSSLKNNERIWIRGVYRTGLAFLLAAVKERINKAILVVLADEEEVQNLFTDIKEFYPHTKDFGVGAYYLPSYDVFPNTYGYEEILNERASNLYSILTTDSCPLIIASLRSFIQKMPSPSSFISSVISLKVMENKRKELIEKLDELGYERKTIVEERGEWSLRGSILDVFTYLYEDPLRIEFSEEKIESIRHFDPATQKSTSKLQKAVILPKEELFQGRRNSTVLSYMPDNTLICLNNSIELKEQAERLFGPQPGQTQEYKNSIENNFFKWQKIRNELSSKSIFFTSQIPQTPIMGYSKVFSLPFQSLEGIGVNLDRVAEKVSLWQKEKFNIFFVSYNEGEKSRLEEILKERGLYPKSNTFLKIGRIDCGFLLSPLKMAVLTDKEIFSRYKFKKPFHQFRETETISSPFQIKRGDYVVHLVHGIGRYLGLNKVQVADTKKEFLMLEYEGGAILYVPVEGLELVHKYVGLDGKSPKLSNLGSSNWRNEKEKVLRACQDIAFELLNMEAIRKTKKGFAFSRDSEWQKEFEASFIYEETKDQLKSAQEIKEDMEKPVPMDRLLCGDAGYGKTEVAIRAAFKAVTGNKQVAILVPTTILAQQHWLNFKDRMKDYPISVEMLSRFDSKSEQNRIINDLKKGNVDIVIGTHRLLQKDVNFKDLGLLVVDEEQRFGVIHKEKLKIFKKTVDVLTLTATPIPRTLYITLSGIRELSMINTPPRDRLAVKTIVAEFSEELIKEAIKNEIARGGQVFFLHNRVENINQIADFVRNLIPDIRVEFAHGQMHEKELEKIMLLFINKKIDVLVTTTIIESGLDIPNANTIIISDAHRLGLADLYQLRGRVGRYRLQAYAYLLVPPKEVLTDESKKRLRALEEFSHLGSGFQLAMQDLEIRGAGNMLGKEQHGHIMKVGLELYMEILKNAVSKLKGKKTVKQITTTVDLNIPAYIPFSYISDESTRLNIYKKIAELKEEKECIDLEAELRDRFGDLPFSAELLLDICKIKINAAKLGIEHIVKKDGNISIKFLKGQNLRKKIGKLSKKYSYSPDEQEQLCFFLEPNETDYKKIIRKILALLQEFAR